MKTAQTQHGFIEKRKIQLLYGFKSVLQILPVQCYTSGCLLHGLTRFEYGKENEKKKRKNTKKIDRALTQCYVTDMIHILAAQYFFLSRYHRVCESETFMPPFRLTLLFMYCETFASIWLKYTERSTEISKRWNTQFLCSVCLLSSFDLWLFTEKMSIHKQKIQVKSTIVERGREQEIGVFIAKKKLYKVYYCSMLVFIHENCFRDKWLLVFLTRMKYYSCSSTAIFRFGKT